MFWGGDFLLFQLYLYAKVYNVRESNNLFSFIISHTCIWFKEYNRERNNPFRLLHYLPVFGIGITCIVDYVSDS